MNNKFIIGIISVVLLAVGVFFCMFLSPSNGKSGDSYALSTSKTSTTTTETTTTKSLFNGLTYNISFVEENEDVHLSKSIENNNTIKITTDDLTNTTWNMTRTKNNKGEQCYLYSIDEGNAIIVSINSDCVPNQPAIVQAVVNNKSRNVKVYIED